VFDIGWFKPGEMVPEFENSAFAMETGQVSEIVGSPFGLHLIKVEQRKQEVTKSLDEVRDEITEILAESRAQKLIDEELEKLLELAGESFAEEAQRLSKEVKKSEWFDRNDVIPGLGSVNELIPELELQKQGEMGIWKRNPVMGHVIYRVGETKGPVVRTFQDALHFPHLRLHLQRCGQQVP
jgi:peptidyl-prolyl cis-trans isomerase D